MIARRTLCILARKPLNQYVQFQPPDFMYNMIRKHQQIVGLVSYRPLSSHQVSKNIEFISEDNQVTTIGNRGDMLNLKKNRPLLIILSWLMSERRHVMKFVNLYMEQGFDVAMVTMTPWQLLWPVKGSRQVATDLLTFLVQNESYQQILLHGFSVGGYMWGEVLDLMNNNKKYNSVLDRVVGQVWDSVADITELSIGTPRAVFPKNVVLQSMLQKYIEYHMKAFYRQSTQYYIRSSQLFHTNALHAPALFFISKTDPIGSLTSIMRVRDTWDSLGIKTYVKIFDKSPHVGHFQKYPKEYVAEVYAFLNKLNLIQNEEKIRARL